MFHIARRLGRSAILSLMVAATLWSQTPPGKFVDPCGRVRSGATLRMTYGGRIYYSFPQYDVFVAGAPTNLDEFVAGGGTGTGVIMRNDLGMRWDGRNFFYHPAYPVETVTRYQYRNRLVESLSDVPRVAPQATPTDPTYRTAYRVPPASSGVTAVPQPLRSDAPRYMAPPLPVPCYQPLPYQPPQYPGSLPEAPKDEESMKPGPSSEGATRPIPERTATSATSGAPMPLKCRTYARFDPECSPWRTP